MIVVRLLRRKFGNTPWYRERVPIGEVLDLDETLVITCKPQPAEGIGNELPADVVAQLEEVDIAVRFGFGILKGAALTAPNHGVLSYHHGDITECRGRPAGFYEFIHGRNTAGITVQRLGEALDTGELAATAECDISDAKSLREVRSRLFEASPPLLLEAVLSCMEDRLK